MFIAIDLDFKTAVISAVTTIVLSPVLLLVLKITARHVLKWVDSLVDGMLYWLSRYIIHGLAARMSLKAYCRLLLSSTKFVPVPSSRDVNLEIDNIFIALNLENTGISQKNVTHATLLTTGNRLRLIGDPGSGKSCLVKRLLRDAAQAGLAKPSTARLPILIELRNLSIPETLNSSDSGEYLYSELRKLVTAMNVYRMGECFDIYSESAGLLVLLDGLDEIASTEYPRVEFAINGLAAALTAKGSNNIIVLTSRTQFHQQVREAYITSYPSVYLLKPFTPTDIYEFLTRWPFHSDVRSNVNRIYQDLTDRPTLRELCGNPLILSMYVAEAEGTAEHIVPDSRTEFYSRVADELLVNRRVRQTRQQGGRTALREMREQILGAVAFRHLLDRTQPANSLKWSDTIHELATHLGLSMEDAEIAFDELSRETGLFTIERPRESFRFIHLTFCEFFAAVQAVKNRHGGWSDLVQTQQSYEASVVAIDKQRLLEVIPFACGLLHQVDRDQAIADVASLNNNRLLARCLLETKRYSHPAWSQFTTLAHRSLLTHNAKISDEWLFDFHLFNIVVRDAAVAAKRTGIQLNTPDVDLVLQEIIGAQETDLARIIDAYAEKDAAAVFRVADVAGIDLVREFPATVIHNLDQRPFMELLLDRAEHPTSDVVGWALVFAEAGLRSRPVAEELQGRPPIAGWTKHIAAVPKDRRWILSGVISKSLYSDAVTLAASASTPPSSSLIRALQKVPPPSSYRVLTHSPIYLVLATLPVVLAFSYAAKTQKSWVVIPALCVFLVPYIMSLSLLGIRRFYHQILALRPELERVNTRITVLDRMWNMVPPKLKSTGDFFLSVRSTVATASAAFPATATRQRPPRARP